MMREIRVSPEDIATRAVNQEQRWAVAFRLNGKEPGIRGLRSLLINRLRELFDCRRLKNGDDRQFYLQSLFNLRKHPDSQQRMSAKFKEIIADADSFDA